MPPICRRIPQRSSRLTMLTAALAAVVLGGCAATFPMMPTPTLYTGADAKPLFTEARPELRTPPLDLLFITDRAPATGAEGGEPYTAERSRSMAFGSTTVQFGEQLTWDALVRQSTTPERRPEIGLTLGPTKELGRFPSIPYKVVPTAGGVMRAPATIDEHEAASRALQAEVSRRLALHPRKEVVLYVHGFNNTFCDAALTMGELCHFMGREVVCAIFTWPAGSTAGILSSYNVDYESSTFAVEHLRKAIRLISQTPGLERIHLIAHSRGTDVLVTALSDLSFEAYTQQSNLSRRSKVGNIVLMAPDLDPDVAVAKIFKAISDPDVPYGPAPNPHMVLAPTPGFRITIYVSPEDQALAASSWLFGNLVRLGRLDDAMLSPEQIEQARTIGGLDLIQFRGKSDRYGHSYFISSAKVSSDLIALLRYGLRPGDAGRRLEEIQKPFWRIPVDPESVITQWPP